MSLPPYVISAVLVFSAVQPGAAVVPETEPMFRSFAQDAGQLAGVWIRVRSDGSTYQKITLILREDGTYTKTLEARVNGSNYGGTHQGTWTARGTVVSLSGDGNWPALTHDLAEFQRSR